MVFDVLLQFWTVLNIVQTRDKMNLFAVNFHFPRDKALPVRR